MFRKRLLSIIIISILVFIFSVNCLKAQTIERLSEIIKLFPSGSCLFFEKDETALKGLYGELDLTKMLSKDPNFIKANKEFKGKYDFDLIDDVINLFDMQFALGIYDAQEEQQTETEKQNLALVSRCKSNMLAIASKLKNYKEKNDTYPKSLKELNIDAICVCPSGTPYVYNSSDFTSSYVITCSSPAHRSLGISDISYSSEKGIEIKKDPFNTFLNNSDILIAIKLKDADKFKENALNILDKMLKDKSINKMDKQVSNNNDIYRIDDILSIAFIKDYLVISDSGAKIAKSVVTFQNNGNNISQDENFDKFFKGLTPLPFTVFYINTPPFFENVLKSINETPDKIIVEFLNDINTISGSSAIKDNNITSLCNIQFNDDIKTQYAKFLLEDGYLLTGGKIFDENSAYFTDNRIERLIKIAYNAFTATDNEAEDKVQFVQVAVSGFYGTSFFDDFKEAFTGELVYNLNNLNFVEELINCDAIDIKNFICNVNRKSADSQLQKYKADKGTPPEKLQDLVPNYLSQIPRCPSGGIIEISKEDLALNCSIEKHNNLSSGLDYEIMYKSIIENKIPLDFAICIGVKDKFKALKILKTLLGQSPEFKLEKYQNFYDHQIYSLKKDNKKVCYFAFVKGFMVIQPGVVPSYIKTLISHSVNKEESLKSNEYFKNFDQNGQKSWYGMSYYNIKTLLPFTEKMLDMVLKDLDAADKVELIELKNVIKPFYKFKDIWFGLYSSGKSLNLKMMMTTETEK